MQCFKRSLNLEPFLFAGNLGLLTHPPFGWPASLSLRVHNNFSRN